MEHIEIYIALLAITTTVGVVFRHSAIPSSLLLVIVGMIIGFLPGFPDVVLDPEVIFNVFLPLLLYEASSYSTTWSEIKQSLRPIALLSIGHVIFITGLVAATIHYLIPDLGWPLAIVLGAVVAPPDDVAIISIAEKVRMPTRVITILKGEAMFNDATALIIYRFALVAAITHQFSLFDSLSEFALIVIGETAYGFVLATFIGNIRLQVRDPTLQMMVSILTPFLAYIPAAKIGGSGVVATVATGLFIANNYWERYPADVRLTARSIWTTLSYGVQSILFLMVGLDLRDVVVSNSYIPWQHLLLYSGSVIAAVIIGRFLWCFPTSYIRKKDPKLPWQYTFIISWAGMRGAISLAAALAIPSHTFVDGLHPRDLLVFLVFSVIIATLLIQGLSLPYILKLIGMPKYGKQEKEEQERAELSTRAAMAAAVLKWLSEYAANHKDDQLLADEIKRKTEEYRALQGQLEARMNPETVHAQAWELNRMRESSFLLTQIIQVERDELSRFFRDGQINHEVKYRLEQQLDLLEKRVEEY